MGECFAERYRIERELGRGGMGAVYLATDLELGRKVALKFAAGRRAETELVRLQQEAKVMAQLSHPGIVTVFEAAAAGDHLFVSLEFVPGGTLRDWVDCERRSWREVVAMFLPIAEALAAAHAAGVVHRDFKPQNVLLGLDGRPRIADFGLARSVASHDTLEAPLLTTDATTQTGAVLGTPAYMAPEQARGERAKAAADQFAFFVTLYEAVVGTRPFPGKTLAAVLDAVEAGPPRECPGMPNALAKIVRRGLADAPGDRHRDMAAVATALADVLHGRRRRIRNAVLTVGLLGAAVLGFAAAPEVAEPCQPALVGASLAEIWNDGTRSRVLEHSGPETADALQHYSDGLASARLEACRAHAVEQTLSADDFALRNACLDRAEARLAGLLDASDALTNPLDLLQSVDRCADTVVLRRHEGALASVSTFDTVAQDDANREGIRLVMQAIALSHSGEDPTEPARQALALGREHGLHAIAAEALVLQAVASDDPTQSSALLDEAESLTDQALPVSVTVHIAMERSNLALRLGRVDVAHAYLAQANNVAKLDVGGIDRRTRLELDLIRAQVDLARGKALGSAETLRGILDRLERDDPQHLFAQSLLADALVDGLQLAEADRAYARALQHPLATDAMTRAPLQINRASALVLAGHAEDAAASLDAFERDWPGDPPAELAAPTRLVRAGVARLNGALDDAREHAGAAAELYASVSPSHPHLAHVLDESARIELEAHAWRAAYEHTQAALEAWYAQGDPESPDAARTLIAMSTAMLALGHPDEAAEAAQTALAALQSNGRPDAELALATLALAAARGTEAEQARRICEASELAQCRSTD